MITNIRRILAVVDLSSHSEAVVARAGELAAAAHCPLTLLHVVDNTAPAVDGRPRPTGRARRHLGCKQMETLSAGLRSQGVELHCETACGVPWEEIVRKIDEDEYDLLVAGRRPRSRIAGLLSGGTAERLLVSCPCPLWVVQNVPSGRIRQVLAAADFSSVSGLALEAAAALAGATGAKLNVLHVMNADPLLMKLAAIRAGAVMQAARDRGRRLRAHEQLEEFIAEHVPDTVYALEKMASGDLVAQLQKSIAFQFMDVVVLGTGDRRGCAGQYRSDTVKRLLGRVSCDILAVRPGSHRLGFRAKLIERSESAVAVSDPAAT